MTKNYDKLFLMQARMGYANYFYRYHRNGYDHDLNERKHLLDKEFVFSGHNVNRLRVINALLTEKSEEAYQHAEKLEQFVLTLIKNPDTFISNYEIQFKLNLFSERKYSNIPDLQGNSFFECEPICFVKAERSDSDRKDHKDWLFKTDHTEIIHEGHPLYSFRHCYLFHDLIDHTILSYQDIVDIEDIWIEVVLTVQNFQVLE